MLYGSKLHIPPTNYHLLAAQLEPYEKSLNLNEFCLRVFWREKSQENGPLSEKRHDRKSKRTRQKEEKNKRGDNKGESNDSPESEIPDRRASDIPGLPSGVGVKRVNQTNQIRTHPLPHQERH